MDDEREGGGSDTREVYVRRERCQPGSRSRSHLAQALDLLLSDHSHHLLHGLVVEQVRLNKCVCGQQ